MRSLYIWNTRTLTVLYCRLFYSFHRKRMKKFVVLMLEVLESFPFTTTQNNEQRNYIYDPHTPCLILPSDSSSCLKNTDHIIALVFLQSVECLVSTNKFSTSHRCGSSESEKWRVLCKVEEQIPSLVTAARPWPSPSPTVRRGGPLAWHCPSFLWRLWISHVPQMKDGSEKETYLIGYNVAKYYLLTMIISRPGKLVMT